MQKSLLLDADPGHDDALAMMLLAGSAKIDLRQLTTVSGNALIEKTTINARAVLRLIEREDIPVFSGADKPLVTPQKVAEVHGASGLDGFDLTGVDAQLTGDAADRIRQVIEATPLNILTLLTTGPLTNVAQALIKNPLLLSRLKETVIMGGAIAVPGNQNRVAEFNICVDPHAADIVFSAPGRKILIPLDVCNDVLIQMKDLDHLPQTKTIRQVRSMLEPYIRNIKQFIGVDGALMYDPIAAFYTLSPESFVIKAMDIRVETRGDLTTGMTVVENRSTIKRNENIFVATELDVDAFLQTFFNSLQKLP